MQVPFENTNSTLDKVQSSIILFTIKIALSLYNSYLRKYIKKVKELFRIWVFSSITSTLGSIFLDHRLQKLRDQSVHTRTPWPEGACADVYPASIIHVLSSNSLQKLPPHRTSFPAEETHKLKCHVRSPRTFVSEWPARRHLRSWKHPLRSCPCRHPRSTLRSSWLNTTEGKSVREVHGPLRSFLYLNRTAPWSLYMLYNWRGFKI